MRMVNVLDHYLIFYCLFLLPIFVFSQTKNDVTIGSSLIAGDDKVVSAWISPSGDFAFGFQKLGNEDQFLVSIWYNNIPEKTIVWYANEDNPSPKGSKLEITSDRGLVLTSTQDQQETLISDPLIGTVASGSMKDTGNFVLANKNFETLWQSFNQSKDTILPGQDFEEGFKLSSRRSETNYSRGRFLLTLRPNGNVALGTVNLPSEFVNEYYYLFYSIDELNESTYQLKFNESGLIFLLANNSQEKILSEGEIGPSTSFYHRATLNFDGVFTLYQHPKEAKSDDVWSPVWSIPENICYNSPASQGSGVCGYNRICRLSVDRRPDCQCPPAFSLVDPEDDYKGCMPDYVQDCGDKYSENEVEMETVTNIDWPTSDYERLEPFDEEECKNSCSSDCMCAVAIIRGSSCWKKKLPLSNGRVDSRVNSKAFIKRKKGNTAIEGPNSSEQKKKNQDTIIIIISVFLGSSVVLNCLLVGVLSLGFLLIYRNKISRFDRNGSSRDQPLRYFSYKDLSKATHGFKEEVGRGAFGIVYKGVVEIGSPVPVAVKKLDRIIQDGDKEFKTEVNVIGQTHHKNLVRLFGFCDEGPQRLLVYEFMNNGALANFLFGDLKLTWTQRTHIAVGIARGLLYLHEECSTQIIHCDVKPQNILLDDQYDPRISDFGLAKLLRMDQSETQTAVRGTKGYVAPEWFRNMPITVKADVYSFGVLLLEIICCRRNVDFEAGEDKAILTYWAYDCYREGKIYDLVENDTDAISDKKKLERFLMVAVWCIQEEPSLRPSMKKIVLMLEEIVEVPTPPCPNPFRTENSLIDAV